MSSFRIVMFLIVAFCCASVSEAEEILWRTNVGAGTRVADANQDLLGPAEIQQFYLAQVFVEEFLDPDFGQPGTISQITTFFDDLDELGQPVDFSQLPGAVFNMDTGQFEIQGTAILNVFAVMGAPDALPMTVDDPRPAPVGNGIEVTAVFSQNLQEGSIEVRACDLQTLGFQIELDERLYIGLTPDFALAAPRPFTGLHLTNLVPIANENESAFRELAPNFGDWMIANSIAVPPSPLEDQLFATIEIRGVPFKAVLLGDVNLDGIVNLLDVGPFVAVVGSGTYQAEADTNQDGVVNLLDVQPFIDLLN